MSQINVLIKDGERIVNWDFDRSTTIAYVLGRFQFKPVRGSVRVGGHDIGQNLAAIRLADCPMEFSPSGRQMRVKITLQSEKPKAEPNKGMVVPFPNDSGKAEEEVDTDVR